MPIDFAAAAQRFAAAFDVQLRIVAPSQRVITAALALRTLAVRATELATSGYPVVRLHSGAVSLMLTPAQRGVLAPSTPVPGIGSQLATGSRAFLTGLADAGAPLRDDSQESAIPRLVDALAGALDDIEASMRRFATPGPQMFDRGARTASDLFGLAGLGYRVVAEAAAPSGQAVQFTDQVHRALRALQGPAGADTAGAAVAGAGAAGGGAAGPDAIPGSSLADRLDDTAFAMLGAIAVLVELPAMLETLLTGLRIRIVEKALDDLERLERTVLGLRRAVFDAVFVGFSAALDKGVRLVEATRELLAANIAFTLKFWAAYAATALGGVRDFVIALANYVRDWMTLTAVLPQWLDVLIAHKLLDLPWPLPSMGLGDLLDKDGTHVNLAKQAELLDVIDAAEAALVAAVAKDPTLVLSASVRAAFRAIHQARTVVDELFTSGTANSEIPVLVMGAPLEFHSDMPLLGRTVFGDGRAEAAIGIVDRLENAVAWDATDALVRARTGLEGLSAAFTAEAARAARFGVGSGLERIAGQAVDVGDTVFGPEVRHQRELRDRASRLGDGGIESLLSLFFAAPVEGTAQVLSAALEGYVEAMATHWRARLAQEPELTEPITPTSPHLLRRRAVLSRVRVPRLTLRASGPLDDELAELVAGRFTGAVCDAHRAGRQRLAEIGGR